MKHLNSTILLFIISFSFSQVIDQSYSFFIAGHTYGKPGSNNIGLHPPFKQKFDYIKGREEIKFGVLLGDIVPTSTVQNWEEVDVDVDSLGMPVYFAYGNHDVDNPEIVKNRYDSTYYSFYYQNDLFIVLDPNIDNWNIKNEQLQFVKTVVNNSPTNIKNIFVFFHQLLWAVDKPEYSSIKLNSYAGKTADINFWTEVTPIFEQKNCKVHFCSGDVGAADWSSDFAFDLKDNFIFIATGMGENIGDNFIIINVDNSKKTHYDLICLSDENLKCFGDLEDYQITISGISTIENEITGNCYPNPFNKHIDIKGFDTFELYNINGNLIMKGEIENEKIEFQNINNDMYFLKVQNKAYSKTYKIRKSNIN